MQMKRAFLLLMPLLMALIVIVFPTNSNAQTGLTLFSFNGTTQGLDPLSNLVMDKAGNLYGTTFVGGTNNSGVVFELSPDGAGGWGESVLYSFTGGADGGDPVAQVIFDSAGNLYGTTVLGGSANLGTVFELTPTSSGWSEKALYSFAGGSDGRVPFRRLDARPCGKSVRDNTRRRGFRTGHGFRIETLGQRAVGPNAVILAFNGNNGDGPRGGLVRDGAGALYGVTQGGGKAKAGVVFKLIPSSERELDGGSAAQFFWRHRWQRPVCGNAGLRSQRAALRHDFWGRRIAGWNRVPAVAEAIGSLE